MDAFKPYIFNFTHYSFTEFGQAETQCGELNLIAQWQIQTTFRGGTLGF